MAIELCSESSAVSPRISFSHDLCLPGITSIEPPYHTRRSSSNSLGSPDFDFCVGKSLERESSDADELFSDGKIVPSDQIKKTTPTATTTQENDGSSSSSPTLSQEQNSSLKEMEAAENKQDSNNSSSKSSSFWRFKRSSSGGSGSYGRSLCPLPLLSRSYSTGSSSASSPPVKKGTTHPKHLKQQCSIKSSSSQSPSSSNNCQKPPLKKNYGNYNVNPVLNVPSGNLFGLGSLFSSSSSPKDKNKKK